MGMFYIGFEDVERGIKELKEAVSLRNQMCGSVYAGALDDEIFKISCRLRSIGASEEIIKNVINGKES